MAQNFDLQQTGPELQNRVNQVPVNTQDIATEVQARIDGDAAVTQECKAYTDAETERSQQAESALHDYVDAETTRSQQAENSLQQQINDIVSGDATVNLTASPTAIFADVESTINLTATTNKNASAIVIKKGSTVIGEGSGTSKSASDTVTPTEVGTIAYVAEFTISGNQRTANRSVSVVLPIYYGVGAEYPAEMTMDNTPRVPGSFNYANIATEAGQYLFFEIPDDKKLTALAVVSAPADTSLSFEQIESQREGYKAYRNVEPRGTGSYTYKLTIAND